MPNGSLNGLQFKLEPLAGSLQRRQRSGVVVADQWRLAIIYFTIQFAF